MSSTSTVLVRRINALASKKALSATTDSLVRISEPVWRAAAKNHRNRIKELLLPGFLPDAHVPPQPKRRGVMQRSDDDMPALNPEHPVYNFLIEYYYLKSTTGPKRLARWSPSPALLMQSQSCIKDLDDLVGVSSSMQLEAVSTHSPKFDGILLEGANEDDFASTLPIRGAFPHAFGFVYSPSDFFAPDDATTTTGATSSVTAQQKHPATPFLWYRSVMDATLKNEPILHCHGFHEWAMLFCPKGNTDNGTEEPPPSSKYQGHLELRVSQDTLNGVVESGISCTHVDALRFFAPGAGKWNHHGYPLRREQQLQLEQPACVHAQMDLLKIILRVRPFHDCQLLGDILELALEARELDVAASPYDVSAYGISAIPVETEDGRKAYRKQQRALMRKAEPLRRKLLAAYDTFLVLSFGSNNIEDKPDSERFAKTEPGGKPWRQNLVSERTRS